MAVNSTHREYDAAAPAWSRARDVLAGEDAVKAAGERYLPRLDSQSDEEYAAYKARAAFFGATGRTLEEYLDLVFRKGPAIALGGCERLKGFAEDCDLWGLDFGRYARRVVGEVLAVGRCGSLVLEQDGRAVVSLWRAEEILNWKVERVGQDLALTEVVLREGGMAYGISQMAEGARVFRVVDGACVEEGWRPGEQEWVLERRATVKRESVAVPFVPFVFHGTRDSRPEPDRLPLGEIIAANLDHYRLDADYKHGLHFAALPTAWVSGFDKATPLRIGSSTAWVSDVPGASAGFLEFSGTGLGHLERAIEKVERRMALLGARMLESGGGENGGAVQMCGLASIVAALNGSLSRVLQIAQWWIEGGELDGLAGKASFAMNTDLAARALTGEEITAVVDAWHKGAISRETMLQRLKRGEVIPDQRTVAEEKALIHGKPGGGR